jgi:N-acetylmuramoyl-L-alanine amidase
MAMRIALIIGHKKASPGACNNNAGICEFEFNEKLAHDIASTGEFEDLHIVYRRTYSQLPQDVNTLNPDVAVSLHCNAFNEKATGSEVLFYHSSTKGKKIADVFQRNIVGALGLTDRGIKPKGAEDRGGYILRYTYAPCIIVEPFFIDNDRDLAIVRNRYDYFVAALINSFKEIEAIII